MLFRSRLLVYGRENNLFSVDTNTDLSELGSDDYQRSHFLVDGVTAQVWTPRLPSFLDSKAHEPKPPHPTLQIHYFGCQNSTATTRLLTNCRLKATVQLRTSTHKGHAAAARPASLSEAALNKLRVFASTLLSASKSPLLKQPLPPFSPTIIIQPHGERFLSF